MDPQNPTSDRTAHLQAGTRAEPPAADDASLFAALRAAFPDDLSGIAIETADGPEAPLRYRWADLEHGSARIANLLSRLDLPPGSRVAVQADKSVESVMLYLAVLRCGFVYLPLNVAYQQGEIAYFLGNAQPAVAVCPPAHFRWFSRLAFDAGVGHIFTLDAQRGGTLLERAALMDDAHTPVPRAPDDLAAIVYTSGTTGRSKGAMLTQRNLLSNARTLQQYWDWQPGDVLLHALPLFHVHGLFVALHGALLNGSPMVWFHKFDAAAVLQRLRDATVFMGVPTLYTRLLAEPGLTPEAVAKVRLFISGSAPLLKETHAQWAMRTGQTILERYGMSETIMITSNPCRPEDGERVAGTVGFALPGIGVRVCDADDQPLPAGDTGGVQVRGPNVFQGYWQMPEKTAEDFTADGWFRTGDVGALAADGRLTLVGRSKDLIISGGYNVYPAEVEDAINALPGVDESAVVGVPHPDFGEGVVAFVTTRPGMGFDTAAAQAALRGQLAGYKLPKDWRVVAALPRNAMGKVQKNLLREQAAGAFAARP